MKNFLLILFLSLVSTNTVLGLDKVNEEFIKYVNSSKTNFNNLEELHSFLIKPAKNNREKAELFFYWISQHIEYDIARAALITNGEKPEKYDVLKHRKGVCEDYSQFFKALCDLSNIECHFIAGYNKATYEKGQPLRITHAWNIVFLDNEYEFVDCTWGSGMVDNDAGYKKDLDLSQVFVNSNKFRELHLPASPKWQLLEHPVSVEKFVSETAFDKMYVVGSTKFNFKDSIAQNKNLSTDEFQLQYRKEVYLFNPTYKNAFTCGNYHELAGYNISRGGYELEKMKKAKDYYEQAKKWYVISFKILNKNTDKVDRSQIEIIKKVNKRIKHCDFRIMTRK